LGWYLKAAGHILIDRSNRKAAFASLDEAGERIRGGISLIFFPEGTRSDDGRVQSFKKGPFALAMKARVALCPVAIEGSGKLMPKNSWRITPGPIRVRIGTPMDISHYRDQDRDLLMEDVRQRIVELNRSMGGKGASLEAETSQAPAATRVEVA
jgi:1-acyl-sn-glycerol-3-phosphate acyltransferase